MPAQDMEGTERIEERPQGAGAKLTRRAHTEAINTLQSCARGIGIAYAVCAVPVQERLCKVYVRLTARKGSHLPGEFHPERSDPSDVLSMEDVEASAARHERKFVRVQEASRKALLVGTVGRVRAHEIGVFG